LNRPEVNQALKNTVAGQEVSLEIAPEAQGEEPVERVSYRFWIREVQERQLPEVDDEMARSLGFEDLQALTAELTRQAAARAADFAAQQLRYQLYDKLVDAHNFTPPGSFVEMIYREILIQNRLEDSDAIRSRLLPQAERRAKLDLIIERIAQAEGIEVTPEEVRTKVTSYAQGLGLKPEELLDSFYRLRRIQGIRAEIRHEKVTNWLLARAVVEG
jgi:trigger factor